MEMASPLLEVLSARLNPIVTLATWHPVAAKFQHRRPGFANKQVFLRFLLEPGKKKSYWKQKRTRNSKGNSHGQETARRIQGMVGSSHI